MTDTAAGLATGWEPTAPLDDTMTRRFLFHWARQCELFVGAAGGRTWRTPEFIASDAGVPNGYFNTVTLLQPPSPSTLPALLAHLRDLQDGGRGAVHLWSLWPGLDLGDAGWTLVGHPPLLVRPPASAIGIPDGTDHDIREVTDRTALAHWTRTAVLGYPLSDVDVEDHAALAPPPLLDDERLRLYVGYEQDDPVSISAAFVEEDLAGFAFAATLPEYRGRHHWHHHARVRLAAAPDLWTVGVFSDLSRPLAEQIGFVPITRFTLWALDRP